MTDDLKFQKNDRRRIVKYVTDDKLKLVNPESLKIYDQYLKTNIVKNKDVKNTTFKVYKSYFNTFLVYILDNWDNFYVLDEDFLEENMIDVMEGYMAFLQDVLENGRKVINTKIATVSAFYMWAVKRRKLKAHPFAGRLDRMKNAQQEKIIAEYFLNKEQVEEITNELSLVEEDGYSEYDWQDRMIWHISFDSACRIGALSKLKMSSYDKENGRFINIREKRGKIVSIPLYPETVELMDEYIKYRQKLNVDCDDLFFSKYQGKWRGISTQALSERVKKIGYIVGVGDFRHHCIRKTRLNLVAKKDINMAKALANHESLDTTARFYTEKKDQADVLQSIIALEEKENNQ